MALAPPGPRSLAIMVSGCAMSISKSFMTEQNRAGSRQEKASLCKLLFSFDNQQFATDRMYTGFHTGSRLPFFSRRKVMTREYRSRKTPFIVELTGNPEKLKSDRIGLGFFMLQAYPRIETTIQTVDLNDYATHTDKFGHSSLKITYTNPRSPRTILPPPPRYYS